MRRAKTSRRRSDPARAALPPPPTKAELEAAKHERHAVPDIIKPGLRLLFVGINPGLYTAAIRRHFGRPGNRFWPAVHAGGFTDRLLSPYENEELLTRGYGITNLVYRATLAADELGKEELRAGARRLERKVRKYRPRFVAVLGVGSYRVAFGRPHAVVGPQPETIAGARLWLLPNPSGLNAHFPPRALAKLFRELHDAVCENEDEC